MPCGLCNIEIHHGKNKITPKINFNKVNIVLQQLLS